MADHSIEESQECVAAIVRNFRTKYIAPSQSPWFTPQHALIVILLAALLGTLAFFMAVDRAATTCPEFTQPPLVTPAKGKP